MTISAVEFGGIVTSSEKESGLRFHATSMRPRGPSKSPSAWVRSHTGFGAMRAVKWEWETIGFQQSAEHMLPEDSTLEFPLPIRYNRSTDAEEVQGGFDALRSE